MKLSALLRTSDFRGDHSTDIAIAHEVLAGETVEAFAARVFAQADVRTDCIELRIVQEPEQEPAQ